MEESNKIEHQIIDILANRWSPRAFSSETIISKEELNQFFEAARWSPSSFNEQPWRFYFATSENASGFKKLLNCLVEFNQSWAKNASVLLAIVSQSKFKRNGKVNVHADYDCGASVLSLSLQALSMGFHVHQMAGFDSIKAGQLCNITKDESVITIIAIGKLTEKNILPQELQDKELEKKNRYIVEALTHEIS